MYQSMLYDHWLHHTIDNTALQRNTNNNIERNDYFQQSKNNFTRDVTYVLIEIVQVSISHCFRTTFHSYSYMYNNKIF